MDLSPAAMRPEVPPNAQKQNLLALCGIIMRLHVDMRRANIEETLPTFSCEVHNCRPQLDPPAATIMHP